MLPDFQCKTNGQGTVSGELLYQLGTAFDIRLHEQVQAAEHGTKRENRDSHCELRPDGVLLPGGCRYGRHLGAKERRIRQVLARPNRSIVDVHLALPLCTDPDAVPAVVAANT